jgi:alpha-galactosidase
MFNVGDNFEWAKSYFDVTSWKPIKVGEPWESQGYVDYDGYGWYHIKFNLPSYLKKKAYLKDTIQFLLGKIDDCDQTFLNGKLLGQNGKSISAGNTDFL